MTWGGRIKWPYERRENGGKAGETRCPQLSLALISVKPVGRSAMQITGLQAMYKLLGHIRQRNPKGEMKYKPTLETVCGLCEKKGYFMYMCLEHATMCKGVASDGSYIKQNRCFDCHGPRAIKKCPHDR